MEEEISLLIKKLLKNILLYTIVGHTKIRKLLLTRLKIKYNAFILLDHIIQFFIQWYRQCNIPFNSTYKEVLYVFSILMIGWREPHVAIKKRCFTTIC